MWHAMSRTDWGEKQQVRLEWGLLKRVFSYFGPYWKFALVVLACIGVAAALGLVPAQITKELVDGLSSQSINFRMILILIGALVLSAIAAGLVGVLQAWLSNRISQGIMYDLRNQLFGHMLRQSVGFFTRSRTGAVMSR